MDLQEPSCLSVVPHGCSVASEVPAPAERLAECGFGLGVVPVLPSLCHWAEG